MAKEREPFVPPVPHVDAGKRGGIRRRSRSQMRELPPRRCDGTSRQSGEPCKNFATPGSTKCWNHGGATSLKQRRHDLSTQRSREDVRSRIEALQSDPNLMDLTRDAALLQALIDIKIERSGLDSLELCDDCRKEVQRVAREFDDDDLGELRKLADSRGKVIAAYEKTQNQDKYLLPAASFLALVQGIGSAINDILESHPELRVQLASALDSLLATGRAPGHRELGAGSGGPAQH